MNKRALIAEPDQEEALRQAAILKDDGYDANVFTGSDLVTAVEQSPPDVIVLRHERPGTQTGLALVARLKTVAPGTAIVLTTSELTPDAIDKNKKQRIHADWYLRLPADRGELVGAARAVPQVLETGDVDVAEEKPKPRDPSRPPPLPPPALRALGQLPKAAPRGAGEAVLSADDLTFVEKVFSSIQHIDADAPIQEPMPSAIGDTPDRKLALLRTKLKERERDLAKLSRLWRAREEDLRQQESKVQQKDIELEGLKLRIRELTTELETAQQTLVDKEAEWGRQMGDTYEQHSLNEAELIQAVAGKEAEINRLKTAMRKAEDEALAERKDFTQRILEWEKAYADFEQHHWKVVIASVDEVVRLEAQVRAREADKGALKVELRERDNLIARLNEQKRALADRVHVVEHAAAVAVDNAVAVTQGALAVERRRRIDVEADLAETRAALLLVEEDVRKHQRVLGRVVADHRAAVARLAVDVRVGDAERRRLADERDHFRRRADELESALAETSALAEATAATMFALEEKRVIVAREQQRVRDEKLAELRDDKARLEDNLADVTTRLGQAEMDHAAETARADDLERDLADTREHAASTETRLQGALDGMTGERDRLTERLAVTEQQLSTTSADLVAEKASREQREVEVAGIVERKDGELADRAQKITELERSLGDAKEDIGNLRKTVSTRDERITELLSRVRQADEQQVQLEAQVFRLETSNTEREATIAARDDRIAQLTANLERQEARGDQLDADLKKANSTLLDRQAHIDRQDAHLADLQKQLASAREDTQATRAELQTRSNELFEAERRGSNLQAELQNARAEIQAGAAVVEQLQAQLSTTESRAADLRRLLEETDAKLRVALVDIDAAGARADQLRAELATARETLQARDAEIHDKARQIAEGVRARDQLQATLDATLADKARVIAEGERAREQLQATIEATLADKARVVAEGERARDEASATLEATRAQAQATLEATQRAHKQALDALEGEKSEIEEQLAQQFSENGALSASLSDAAGRIEELQARASQLESGVADRDGQLAANAERLAIADQKLAMQGQLLAERENELAETRQALDDARSAIDERARWLATRESAIAELKLQAEAERKARGAAEDARRTVDAELARLRADVERTTAALNEREQQLAALSSTSAASLGRERQQLDEARGEVEKLRAALAAKDAELQQARPAEAKLAEAQKSEAHVRAEYQKLRAQAEKLLGEHKAARALLEKQEADRKAAALELEQMKAELERARTQEATGTAAVAQTRAELETRTKELAELRAHAQRAIQAGQAAQKAKADLEAELERQKAIAEQTRATALDAQAAEVARLQKEVLDARKAQRDAQMQAQQAKAEAEQIKKMAAQRLSQARTVPPTGAAATTPPSPAASASASTAMTSRAPAPVVSAVPSAAPADPFEPQATVAVSDVVIPAAARGPEKV